MGIWFSLSPIFAFFMGAHNCIRYKYSAHFSLGMPFKLSSINWESRSTFNNIVSGVLSSLGPAT